MVPIFFVTVENRACERSGETAGTEAGNRQDRKADEMKKKKPQVLVGEYTAHPRGFGFVSAEGETEDIFIPPGKNNGALHQDTVEIEVCPSSGKRKEGRVRAILEHGLENVVGTYQQSRNYGFVLPDNPRIHTDIFVAKERSLDARDGQKVVVELTDFHEPGKNPEGAVTKVLGFPEEPGVDIESIIREYDVPDAFSRKILNQAGRVAKPVSEADRAGRSDFRSWQTVTIDGEDAKDLDDAITLTKEGGIYTLGVHIADVTNYVQENSALDREALKRGTSIYLVDRVIPMLPQALSNGMCSLNQGEDRLALSCVMQIDESGKMLSHQIVESVIRVDRRMSYTAVNQIITEQDPAVQAEYAELVPMFFRMKELSAIIRRHRAERGSIDFDFPETKVVLDDRGVPVDIHPYERNAATKLIEDFMLAANETVAEHFFWQQLPFVYRTHEAPEADRIRALSIFIANFGLHIHGAVGHKVHPKEIQKLLAEIDGEPEEPLIARLTLRAMQQAKYTTVCTGHFGLAARYYCHFTSPIRRYPDLQIHRIIKENIRGRLKEDRIEHYNKILPGVAEESSRLERRAEEMERETIRLKKTEYMENHLGECFDGVISGVTAYGFYVELPNTVEGLVHISSLHQDYFTFCEDTWELVGEHTGIVYRLGMPVRIQVAHTDRLMRTIDFVLAPEEQEEQNHEQRISSTDRE